MACACRQVAAGLLSFSQHPGEGRSEKDLRESRVQ